MKVRIPLNGNTIMLAVVLLAVLGVYIWVQVDRTGEVRGIVEYADGRPAAEVRVRLRERMHNLIGSDNITYTDQHGRFVYTDLEMIEFIIDARAEVDGEVRYRTESKRYHLYFKGQDYELPEPLVLRRTEEQ